MDIGLPGKAIFDHDDLRVEGNFALGKSIECIEDLFRILAAGQLDLDFNLFCGVVVDRLDLDLALSWPLHRSSGSGSRWSSHSRSRG